MPRLRELQQVFARSVFDARDARMHRYLRATSVPPGVSMEVYRNNTFTNLTAALAELYSAVQKLVGKEFFEHAAAQYIRETPSTSGNLNDYGGSFAEFLAVFPPAVTLPYLPDVARLEWLMHEALLAPEAAPMNFNRLAEIPPHDYGRICFQLHPSVRLLSSSHPLFRIWRLCQDDSENGDTSDAVSLSEGGVYLLVSRPADKVEITALGAGEFVLFSAIRRQAAFADACEQALRSDPELDVTACLQRYALAHTVTGWRI